MAWQGGVTLLELLTVIVIIAILALMTMPVLESVRRQIERIRCAGNLRVLYHGANSHVQDKGYWPQISTRLLPARQKEYDQRWVEALKPYGVSHQAWICPTVQHLAGDKDYASPQGFRTDYLAMVFDAKPLTPYRWPRMPWFVERGDVHGNGQLMIFTDGSVQALKEVARKR